MPTTQHHVCLYWDIENSTGLRSQLTTPVWETTRRQVVTLFKSCLPEENVVTGSESFFGGKLRPARIISDNGDGDLAIFVSSKDAVETALKFQWKVSHHDWNGVPIRVCVGIDGGDTDLRETDDHGVLIPTGKVLDNGSRVASIARPGQILVTARVSADARDHMSQLPNEIRHREDGTELKLHFAKHGFFDYQGRLESDDLLFVCEVGVLGITPFESPPNSAKCWPCDDKGTSIVTEKPEWQPIQGALVPGNTGGSWELVRKLGTGGFGEAWLAIDQHTRVDRVFKFPNDPQRARSFFRETTLSTFVQKQLARLGDAHHANAIAKVLGIAKDAPYWIATEHYPEGSLSDWCASQSKGIASLDSGQRIQFIIELCRAVHAAHQVEVIHRDIKPGNIFIRHDPRSGTIHPILADFGIGCILRPELLDEEGYTRAGFTHPNSLGPGSRTGTSLYAPPEYEKMGAKASPKGDVYSIGVLLYQMLIDDFAQPWESAQECERRIPDSPDPDHPDSHLNPFIRKAILKALDAEDHRFASAEAFAEQLAELQADYEDDEATKARDEAVRQATLREEADRVASLASEAARSARLAQSEAERRTRLFRRAALLIGGLSVIALALAIVAKRSQLQEVEQKQQALEARNEKSRYAGELDQTLTRMAGYVVDLKPENATSIKHSLADTIAESARTFKAAPDEFEKKLTQIERLRHLGFMYDHVITGSAKSDEDAGKAIQHYLQSLRLSREVKAPHHLQNRLAEERVKILFLLATQDVSKDIADRFLTSALAVEGDHAVPGEFIVVASSWQDLQLRWAEEGIAITHSFTEPPASLERRNNFWVQKRAYLIGRKAEILAALESEKLKPAKDPPSFNPKSWLNPWDHAFTGNKQWKLEIGDHRPSEELWLLAADLLLEEKDGDRYDYWSVRARGTSPDSSSTDVESKMRPALMTRELRLSYRIFDAAVKLRDRHLPIRFRLLADLVQFAAIWEKSDVGKARKHWIKARELIREAGDRVPANVSVAERHVEVCHSFGLFEDGRDTMASAEYFKLMRSLCQQLAVADPERFAHWKLLEVKSICGSFNSVQYTAPISLDRDLAESADILNELIRSDPRNAPTHYITLAGLYRWWFLLRDKFPALHPKFVKRVPEKELLDVCSRWRELMLTVPVLPNQENSIRAYSTLAALRMGETIAPDVSKEIKVEFPAQGVMNEYQTLCFECVMLLNKLSLGSIFDPKSPRQNLDEAANTVMDCQGLVASALIHSDPTSEFGLRLKYWQIKTWLWRGIVDEARGDLIGAMNTSASALVVVTKINLEALAGCDVDVIYDSAQLCHQWMALRAKAIREEKSLPTWGGIVVALQLGFACDKAIYHAGAMDAVHLLQCNKFVKDAFFIAQFVSLPDGPDRPYFEQVAAPLMGIASEVHDWLPSFISGVTQSQSDGIAALKAESNLTAGFCLVNLGYADSALAKWKAVEGYYRTSKNGLPNFGSLAEIEAGRAILLIQQNNDLEALRAWKRSVTNYTSALNGPIQSWEQYQMAMVSGEKLLQKLIAGRHHAEASSVLSCLVSIVDQIEAWQPLSGAAGKQANDWRLQTAAFSWVPPGPNNPHPDRRIGMMKWQPGQSGGVNISFELAEALAGVTDDDLKMPVIPKSENQASRTGMKWMIAQPDGKPPVRVSFEEFQKQSQMNTRPVEVHSAPERAGPPNSPAPKPSAK